MSQQETKHSKLLLKFGSKDDFQAVDDVIIMFRGAPKFSLRGHCESKGYTKCLIDQSCNGLTITATGSKDPEVLDGMTYIPMTSIFRFGVDWLPGTKRQG